MGPYARLDRLLADTTSPLVPKDGEDESFRREVVPLQWWEKILSPKCPKCGQRMQHQVVGIERNKFVGVEQVLQYYGFACIACGVVDEMLPDIN